MIMIIEFYSVDNSTKKKQRTMYTVLYRDVIQTHIKNAWARAFVYGRQCTKIAPKQFMLFSSHNVCWGLFISNISFAPVCDCTVNKNFSQIDRGYSFYWPIKVHYGCRCRCRSCLSPTFGTHAQRWSYKYLSNIQPKI